MGNLERALVPVVAAIVVGGIAYGLAEGAPYAEEQNQAITACVPHLGETAIRAASLPSQCMPAEPLFDQETTTVEVYSPKSGHTTKATGTMYLLPSREAFVSGNLQSTSQVDMSNAKLNVLKYDVSPLVGVAAAVGANAIIKKRRESKSSPIIAEQVA